MDRVGAPGRLTETESRREATRSRIVAALPVGILQNRGKQRTQETGRQSHQALLRYGHRRFALSPPHIPRVDDRSQQFARDLRYVSALNFLLPGCCDFRRPFPGYAVGVVAEAYSRRAELRGDLPRLILGLLDDERRHTDGAPLPQRSDLAGDRAREVPRRPLHIYFMRDRAGEVLRHVD